MPIRLICTLLIVTLATARDVMAQIQPTAEQKPSSAAETPKQRDERMRWWREARFGMFIHWGLYAIPAGQWGDRTDYGEWIRDKAQIPVDRYEEFRDRFNPQHFDADAWAALAKEAGCKYVVITTKHHDGFCLFDSKQTDWDVMSTPFKRDIMKELSEACRRAGLRMGWYYSIMDWHHPDYVPRRAWEKRSAAGANFANYVNYMKSQLRELLTNYGPISVVWFDGQWEGSWDNDTGIAVAKHVRQLQPATIINSRVAKFSGFYGFDPQYAGVVDYGTPEQEIPDSSPVDIDWETCMTMNDHWGYNARDDHFKSVEELIRKLVDIASKGGNFLLNVGPDANGEIPPTSVEHLKAVGAWMRSNGESIYATCAGALKSLPWGRCTQKSLPDGTTRLYLHVFDWPRDGVLRIEGLLNQAIGDCYLLSDAERKPLRTTFSNAERDIELPPTAPDKIDSVVVLDLKDAADVAVPPIITAQTHMFIDTLSVLISTTQANVELRATKDGADPRPDSPVVKDEMLLNASSTIVVRAFRDGKAITPAARAVFQKVRPQPAENRPDDLKTGLHYQCFEGEFSQLPDFSNLKPSKAGICSNLDHALGTREDRYALRFEGYIQIPGDDVYVFTLASDDGSKLFVRDQLLIDHDGLHSVCEKSAEIALAAGVHPIRVEFFEATGGAELSLSFRTATGQATLVSDDMLFHAPEPSWARGSTSRPAPR